MSDELIVKPDKKYVKQYVAVFYDEESGNYFDVPLESKTEPKVVKEAAELEKKHDYKGVLIQVDRITRLRIYTSSDGQRYHIKYKQEKWRR